jgi:metal-responsive CopG/Arc/MetJ family transcriptional regulator
MSTTQVISVSLPRQTLQRVDSLAREEDRSRSKVVARALDAYLDALKQESAAAAGAAATHLRAHARLSGMSEE